MIPAPGEPTLPKEPPPVQPEPNGRLGNGWFITYKKFSCEDLSRYFYPNPTHYYRKTFSDKSCQLVVGHQDGQVIAIEKYDNVEIPLVGLEKLASTSDRIDVGNRHVTISIYLDRSEVVIDGLTDLMALYPE